MFECLAVDNFEGHSAAHTLHQVASFGIEVDDEVMGFASLLSLSFEVSQGVHIKFAIRQTVTVAEGVDGRVRIVAFRLGFFKNRKYAREDARQIAGVFVLLVHFKPTIGGDNFLVESLCAVLIHGTTLCPVGHVARVGSHFVEACDENHAVELDVAIAQTIHDFDVSFLYDVTAWVKQFHIDYLAEVAKPTVIGTNHIDLKPHGFALEVARVVEMKIHFLLWKEFVEAHGSLHVGENTVVGVGIQRCRCISTCCLQQK